MTYRGIVTVLILALLLFLALATGFSEIFYIVFTGGLVLLFSAFSAVLGALFMRFGHSLSADAVTQGEQVTLIIAWEGITAPVCMSMRALCTSDMSRNVVDYRLFGRRASLHIPVQCPHRGRWDVGIENVRCGDLFGLFSLPLKNINRPDSALHLTVYPLLLDIPGQPAVLPDAYDTENPHQNADHGDTFSDIRQYQDGDSLKRIHWKLSARTNELYTRQYEAPAAQTVLIVVDTSALPGESRESGYGYADMVTSAAASLVLYCLRAGYLVQVRISTQDGYREDTVGSIEEFDEIYAVLASTEFGGDMRSGKDAVLETVFPNDSAVDGVGRLYVLTRNPEQSLAEAMSTLCSRRIWVALVYLGQIGSETEIRLSDSELNLIPVARPRDIIDRLGVGE